MDMEAKVKKVEQCLDDCLNNCIEYCLPKSRGPVLPFFKLCARDPRIEQALLDQIKGALFLAWRDAFKARHQAWSIQAGAGQQIALDSFYTILKQTYSTFALDVNIPKESRLRSVAAAFFYVFGNFLNQKEAFFAYLNASWPAGSETIMRHHWMNPYFEAWHETICVKGRKHAVEGVLNSLYLEGASTWLTPNVQNAF